MPRTKEAFQQIRDESKQHILDKAAEVFASKGLASTKISDLAEAAGISQGLLYRYFSSKEDVFIELLERAVHGAVQRAQAALELPGTPWNRLLRLTEQFLKGMSEEPMYHQIFSQALALPGRAREIVEELGALMYALRQLIIDGQTEGQIAKRRDPDQLVLLYLCCLYGLAAGAGFNSRALMAHFPDAENILQILKA
jgi:AcrR family transcriptional regulator